MDPTKLSDGELFDRVRKRLLDNGLNPDEHISMYVGVHRGTVWRWRKGREETPPADLQLHQSGRNRLIQWLLDHPEDGVSDYQRGFDDAVR